MVTHQSGFRAAVLGSPIAHSLSPALYRAGFAAAGLVGWQFDAVECDAAKLPAMVSDLDDAWAGLAVTMPGKQAAAELADTRSDRVAAMGAANTLVRRGPRWHADNTDVDGVAGALTAAGITPSGSVLLLGGGGTARAAIMALAELSWDGELIVAGRWPQSTVIASELAREQRLTVRTTGVAEADIAAVAGGLTLAISTLPAGAADGLAPTLRRVPALLDVVYHPWPTPLAAAGDPGRTTITGLDMLLHQALAQFALVTGKPAPAEAMRLALQQAVGTNLPLPI